MPLYTEFDKPNGFYINKFRKLIKWFVLLSVINLFAIFAVYYTFKTRPAPMYYASTSDGRIFEVKNYLAPVYEAAGD